MNVAKCDVATKGSNVAAVNSETLVYVNGICTTKRMARATGVELANMLQRDVTVIHNPTDSALVDLLEVQSLSCCNSFVRSCVQILESVSNRIEL